MRRPEARNVKSWDASGLALAVLIVLAVGGTGAPWTVPIAAGFAAVYCFARSRRIDLNMTPWMWGPVVLFGLAVAAVLLAASPLAIGGRHPLWDTVAQPGGASIDLEADYIGLIELTGLGFAGLAGFYAGAAKATARSVPSTLAIACAVLGLLALGVAVASTVRLNALQSPLFADPGLRGCIFGVGLILGIADLQHRWRDSRSRTSKPMRSRLALPAAMVVVLAAALMVTADPAAVITAGAMVTLALAWTALTGGDDTRVPNRVLATLVPAVAILGVFIAIWILGRLSETPASAMSRSAHWGAFWASPWSGYGLDTQAAVSKLFMTRINLSAMAAFPAPTQSYLVWLEQGGVLAAMPLVIAIIWATSAILTASIRSRRLGGMMRTIVCASLYLLLYGLASGAPALFPVGALWAVLLGVGLGAAAATR